MPESFKEHDRDLVFSINIDSKEFFDLGSYFEFCRINFRSIYKEEKIFLIQLQESVNASQICVLKCEM